MVAQLCSARDGSWCGEGGEGRRCSVRLLGWELRGSQRARGLCDVSRSQRYGTMALLAELAPALLAVSVTLSTTALETEIASMSAGEKLLQKSSWIT